MRINKTVSNMTQRLESVLTLKFTEVGGMALFDEQIIYDSPCQSATVRQRFCEDLCFAMPDSSVPQCACAYGTLSVDRRSCTRKQFDLLNETEDPNHCLCSRSTKRISFGSHGKRDPFNVNGTTWFIDQCTLASYY